MKPLKPRPRLYKPFEVAEILRKSESTLERWRRLMIGPFFLKFGSGSIRYPAEDLQRFIEESRVETEG